MRRLTRRKEVGGGKKEDPICQASVTRGRDSGLTDLMNIWAIYSRTSLSPPQFPEEKLPDGRGKSARKMSGQMGDFFGGGKRSLEKEGRVRERRTPFWTDLSSHHLDACL